MRTGICYAGLSDRGRVRETNEDNWFADPERGLFIVADGMGGEFAGALAARAVVTALPALIQDRLGAMPSSSGLRARRCIENAIAFLSVQLREQTRNEPGLDGMGSTVVCVLVRDRKAVVAHMGDSRAYLLRKGGLRRLTADHTLVEVLLHREEITPKEASMHHGLGRLTRNVGMPGEPLPESRLIGLDPSDLIMLCTDGLTGILSDKQIQAILKEPASLKRRCRHLVEAANNKGGSDNITALLISSFE